MNLKLYIFGFIIFAPLASFSNNWIKKANFGGVGRHRSVGINIGNKGYIGLGHVNGTGNDISYKDWWQYDPASDSWTQKANYPTVNHGAVAFSANNKGYVGGGSYLNSEFFAYDPVTNSWTPIAPCPVTPGDIQAFSVQDKGYVYYGYQLFEYNPANNSWTEKAPCPINLYSWSNSFSTYSSGFVKAGTSLFEYKPAQNQWIQRATFPGLMSNGGGAFSINEKGYFVCGYVGSLSTVTDQVWEFNPGSNTWTMIEEFPGTSRRFSVAFSINEKGYFGTGTNGINLNDFWEFYNDPLELSEKSFEDFNVSVYPNPSSDMVEFTFHQLKPELLNECELIIYSTEGRIIENRKINSSSLTIERKGLSSGIYLYSIMHSGDSKFTGKIIYY